MLRSPPLRRVCERTVRNIHCSRGERGEGGRTGIRCLCWFLQHGWSKTLGLESGSRSRWTERNRSRHVDNAQTDSVSFPSFFCFLLCVFIYNVTINELRFPSDMTPLPAARAGKHQWFPELIGFNIDWVRDKSERNHQKTNVVNHAGTFVTLCSIKNINIATKNWAQSSCFNDHI